MAEYFEPFLAKLSKMSMARVSSSCPALDFTAVRAIDIDTQSWVSQQWGKLASLCLSWVPQVVLLLALVMMMSLLVAPFLVEASTRLHALGGMSDGSAPVDSS